MVLGGMACPNTQTFTRPGDVWGSHSVHKKVRPLLKLPTLMNEGNSSDSLRLSAFTSYHVSRDYPQSLEHLELTRPYGPASKIRLSGATYCATRSPWNQLRPGYAAHPQVAFGIERDAF